MQTFLGNIDNIQIFMFKTNFDIFNDKYRPREKLNDEHKRLHLIGKVSPKLYKTINRHT